MCCVFDWGGSSNAFGIFSCYDDRRNRWASGWAEEIRTTAHCQELSGMRKCSMHARPPLMSNDDIRSCPLAGIHLAQKASLRFVRGQQFNVVPRIVREARFDRHRPTAPRPSRRKTVFRTPLAPDLSSWCIVWVCVRFDGANDVQDHAGRRQAKGARNFRSPCPAC